MPQPDPAHNDKPRRSPGLPFGLSWDGFYAVVLAWLVVQIILFYIITILYA